MARRDASGLVTEALSAFREDYAYAVEIAREHARLERARAKQLLSPEAIKRARALWQSGMTLRRVAASLGVGEFTLYLALKQSLPPRSASNRTGCDAPTC